jgi:hypothetical protein
MRRTGLAVAILLASLVLYGCGGSEKNPAPADNGSTQTTNTGGGGYGY